MKVSDNRRCKRFLKDSKKRYSGELRTMRMTTPVLDLLLLIWSFLFCLYACCAFSPPWPLWRRMADAAIVFTSLSIEATARSVSLTRTTFIYFDVQGSGCLKDLGFEAFSGLHKIAGQMVA